MEAEHCSMGGCEDRFEVGNKARTTWPTNEWAITVRGDYMPVHVGPSRILQPIAELMQSDVVKQSKLTRHEVISAVLYTGPMVS